MHEPYEAFHFILISSYETGQPPPRVSWWSGATLLADRSYVLGADGTILSSQEMGLTGRVSLSYESSKKGPGLGIQPGNGPPYVVTELTIPTLTKDHAKINISCRASNNNLTSPIVKSVMLSVYCKFNFIRLVIDIGGIYYASNIIN